jgi:hypothetical protein
MDMTDEESHIGRWLGISHQVGSDMTYWILTESGKLLLAPLYSILPSLTWQQMK